MAQHIWKELIWPSRRQQSAALFWGAALAVFWLCFYYAGGLLSGYTSEAISWTAAATEVGACIIRETLRGLLWFALWKLLGKRSRATVVTVLVFTAAACFTSGLPAENTGLLWCQTLMENWLPALTGSLFLTVLTSMGGILPGILYTVLTGALPCLIPIRPVSWRWAELLLYLALPLIFVIVLDCEGEEEGSDETAGVGETGKPSSKRRGLSVTGRILGIGLVVFAICLFLGVLPWRLTAIATGSMEPTLQVGDLVIVSRTQREPVVGDIIQFERDGVLVVHRVEDVTEEDGETVYITRGDANNTTDSGVVETEDITGTVVGKIPYVGWFSLWLQEG